MEFVLKATDTESSSVFIFNLQQKSVRAQCIYTYMQANTQTGCIELIKTRILQGNALSSVLHCTVNAIIVIRRIPRVRVCMCVKGGERVEGLWCRRGRKDGTGLSSGTRITFHHNGARQETTGSHIALLSHRVLSDTLLHSSVTHTHTCTHSRAWQPGQHSTLQDDIILKHC